MAVITRDERVARAMEQGLPVDDFAGSIVINDRRGQPKEPKPEVHGKVAGFTPAGDYVLIRRNKSQEQDGLIVRPEVAVELAERGVVVAASKKAAQEIPLGAIAKFSKYGAEDINFDDDGQDRYALVRTQDIRGWHLA